MNDRETAESGLILRGLVGSNALGLNLPGTDDRDEMAVFVEPPERVAGTERPLDSVVYRTAGEGRRSRPGDLDLTCYSLRKYLRLALAGNPSILILLYLNDEHVLASTPAGDALRRLAPAIVSRQAGRRFLGYLDGQRERLLGGGKQGRMPKRPELVERHGWDVKYGYHALRLGLQGVELMRTGRITLPMRVGERTICMLIREGEVPFDEALRLIDATREALRALVDGEEPSPLRETPNLPVVNAWAVNAHLDDWATR